MLFSSQSNRLKKKCGNILFKFKPCHWVFKKENKNHVYLAYILNNTSLRQYNQWPNLKNLSGGLNLSRGLNIVGST